MNSKAFFTCSFFGEKSWIDLARSLLSWLCKTYWSSERTPFKQIGFSGNTFKTDFWTWSKKTHYDFFHFILHKTMSWPTFKRLMVQPDSKILHILTKKWSFPVIIVFIITSTLPVFYRCVFVAETLSRIQRKLNDSFSSTTTWWKKKKAFSILLVREGKVVWMDCKRALM